VGPELGEVAAPVGGVDHQHVPVGKAVDEQVVEQPPLVVEQRGILRLPHLDAVHVVRGDVLNEVTRPRAPHLDLAHVGDVEQPRAAAHRLVLRGDPRRILHRHLVAGEGHHPRPERHVLGVKGSVVEGHREGGGHLAISFEF
jgi:hypothetical protein